jgi:hypothetical protein
MGAFTPAEVARLADLRRRYDRGEFRELTDAQRRLRFARWLVARGRLSEALDRRDGYADLLRLLARPRPRRKAGARTVACRLPPRAR